MSSFLKTFELTTSILKIISSAKEYCYIVSPYIKIWPQLDRVLRVAAAREVFITFIIRDHPQAKALVNTLNNDYGFEVYVVKDLHIKLYLNENDCLISSMNLYDTSQYNNLELGYSVRMHKNLKQELIDDYILSDNSVIRHPGKFEEKRNAQLNRVKEIKEILKQKGYCVDCKTRIDLDYRSAHRVRCRDCYFKYLNTDHDQTRYCHYCGKKHESISSRPFDHHCEETLANYRAEIKHYQ